TIGFLRLTAAMNAGHSATSCSSAGAAAWAPAAGGLDVAGLDVAGLTGLALPCGRTPAGCFAIAAGFPDAGDDRVAARAPAGTSDGFPASGAAVAAPAPAAGTVADSSVAAS